MNKVFYVSLIFLTYSTQTIHYLARFHWLDKEPLTPLPWTLLFATENVTNVDDLAGVFKENFDVICNLLLNRRTATWNMFVLYNNEANYYTQIFCLFQKYFNMRYIAYLDG